MSYAMRQRESVYNLIPKKEVYTPKPPMYISKFRPTVILEKKSAKHEMRTMGPAIEEVNPEKYLKKHSKEPKLPEKTQRSTEVRNSSTARKPLIPARTDNPLMGIHTKRDFVKTPTMVPRKPQPYIVDDIKGHKQLLENSAVEEAARRRKIQVPKQIVSEKPAVMKKEKAAVTALREEKRLAKDVAKKEAERAKQKKEKEEREAALLRSQKPPIYISKFRPTVILEKKSDKHEMRTMGPAKEEVDPEKYLKKHSKEAKLPEKTPCSTEVRNTRTARKPPIPARTDNPLMGIHTKRDFVKTPTMVPRKPQPYIVDDIKGHKQLLENSAVEEAARRRKIQVPKQIVSEKPAAMKKEKAAVTALREEKRLAKDVAKKEAERAKQKKEKEEREAALLRSQKPPIYISKFRPTVIQEKKSDKHEMRTMGPAKEEVDPEKYLKKHSKEAKLPEKTPCSTEVRNARTVRKPPIPARTAQTEADRSFKAQEISNFKKIREDKKKLNASLADEKHAQLQQARREDHNAGVTFADKSLVRVRERRSLERSERQERFSDFNLQILKQNPVSNRLDHYNARVSDLPWVRLTPATTVFPRIRVAVRDLYLAVVSELLD